jgi:hypothetical protein
MDNAKKNYDCGGSLVVGATYCKSFKGIDTKIVKALLHKQKKKDCESPFK